MVDNEARIHQPERLGTIAFNADLGTGILEVTLTAPFGLQSLKAKVPLIDVLENVAQINVAVCQLQRQLGAQLRAQMANGGRG